MISQSRRKLVRSLRDKKGRAETGLFLVEGEKSAAELLGSDFHVEFLIATQAFAETYRGLIEKRGVECEIAEQDEIEKLGNLESNDAAIAVAKQKPARTDGLKNEGLILALDEVKDPGNLGTIVRIADWYGVKRIVASKNTADFYNAKTIAASMGSFARISVEYADLPDFFSKNSLPVFGAYLEGENVHKAAFPSAGILLMGNESNGISKDLEKFVGTKITIPRTGLAESLNVAIATAVILDNWRKSV